jgi:CRP/FNR family transcriptional regulator, cyclic AMP receptor protein
MREHGVPATNKSKARDRRVAKARITKAGSATAKARTGRKGSSTAFDTEAFLTTVGAGRTITTYKAKSYIFRQGAGCDAVFYIQKGQVELSVVSKQGKERVVGVLSPGAFLGEGCLAGHPRYLASARASTEAVVARVETATLAKALKDHPELSQRFMGFLLLRNSQVEADLVDQLFNSSEKRLARLLVMLAQVGQEAELRTVVTPISQEVMAARVGTTRSRINYFMNKFRKLGLIEYNGELKVHSSLLNVIIRE